MKRKILLFFCLTFCLMLLGLGCKKIVSKEDTEEVIARYCDIYVNKFQERDLASYDIDINDTEESYYKDVEDCIISMRSLEDDAEQFCQQYGGGGSVSCDEARYNRHEIYKKLTTKEGCLENGRDFRCSVYDTKQTSWQGADQTQLSQANTQFNECLQKVEYSCADLPERW